MKSAIQFFTFFCLLTVIMFISLFLYYKLDNSQELVGWTSYVAKAMYLYLGFIFLRTAMHLFLAFASLFFSLRIKKLKSFPLVSILVPCYNEDKVVESALKSIQKLTYPNYEIVVIDDGSSDSTLDLLSSLHSNRPGENARIRIIHQNNKGKAEALNLGVSEAQGDYILCVDADSELTPTVIEESLPLLIQNEKVAAVAGSIEVGNYNTLLCYFQSLEYISGLNLFKEAQSFLGMVTVVPGPVGLFKKKLVKQVGGYRSNTYAEDCELTLRLLVSGYRVLYTHNMKAFTEVPEDYSSLIKQRYRWSRGVFKAIKENSFWLMNPLKSFRNTIIILYMFVESFVIPSVNFLFSFIALSMLLTNESKLVFGSFFVQLLILDVVLAMYCLTFEPSRSFKMIFLSILNRFTYGFSLEILRFFSLLDEILNVPLSWGKLLRKGMNK